MPDTALRSRDSDAQPQQVTLDQPPELRTIYLGGLFALAALAACYAAAEIVLPIVLGIVLNLVFQPVLRLLRRIGVPRVLAALLIVLALVAVFVVIGLLLSGPVTEWIGKVPRVLPQMQEKLRFLSAPVKSMQRALEHIENLA